MTALDLELLARLQEKPQLYSAGGEPFWTDPYISGQLLAAHLDTGNDLASRRPDTIDREVEWLVTTLGLTRGERVLDLGCGPGLYSSRLARRGLDVTGVDFSEGSVDYARQQATKQQLPVRYVWQDYLTLDYCAEFDAALLINYDLGPLLPAQRDTLLERVFRALRPGGLFAFDILTPAGQEEARAGESWSVSPKGGFWSPRPYMVLSRSFAYAGEDVELDQYILVDEGGARIYRFWTHFYTPETITAVLEALGFEVERLVGDLAGTPYTDGSATIGVIARRPG